MAHKTIAVVVACLLVAVVLVSARDSNCMDVHSPINRCLSNSQKRMMERKQLLLRMLRKEARTNQIQRWVRNSYKGLFGNLIIKLHFIIKTIKKVILLAHILKMLIIHCVPMIISNIVIDLYFCGFIICGRRINGGQ